MAAPASRTKGEFMYEYSRHDLEGERWPNAYDEESLEITEPRGELYDRIHSLLTFSIAAWQEGDRERATALVTQALVMSIDDHSRAAALLGVTNTLAHAIGMPM